MTDNYLQAVECVVDTFRGRIKNGQIASFSTEPTEFLYRFGLRIEQEFDGNTTSYSCPPGTAEWLCMKALTDKGAFDLVCSIVASKLFLGQELSYTLRVFAGLRVAGLNPAPKSRKISKTFEVNLRLLTLARSISTKFNLPATRNEASPPFSVCDAIAEGLGKLGHNRSWRAIKELLVNRSSDELRLLEEEIRNCALSTIHDDPATLAKWQKDSAMLLGTEIADPPPS